MNDCNNGRNAMNVTGTFEELQLIHFAGGEQISRVVPD